MSDKRWIKDEDGEPECSMCGAESTIQIIDGTFRVARCRQHRATTWEAWRAQRAITHPPRPPRRDC